MTIYYESDKKILELLNEHINFDGKSMLDIGCGDGTITISLAEGTKRTVGIDPDVERITTARTNTPSHLRGRLEYKNSSIDDYNPAKTSTPFDIAFYLWSL